MNLLKKYKTTQENGYKARHSRNTLARSVTVIIMLVTFFINPSAWGADNTIASSNENWQRGENLFVGKIRFTNGGPACNSCHNVSIKGFVSGGALGKDLTQAITRLTPDGAKAFFGTNPMPMPQMQHSYDGKPLTTEEVNDVLAFLVYSDNLAKTTQPTTEVGKRMITGGIIGVAGLLILFSIFWVRRKQRPVNFKVFERQIKSS